MFVNNSPNFSPLTRYQMEKMAFRLYRNFTGFHALYLYAYIDTIQNRSFTVTGEHGTLRVTFDMSKIESDKPSYTINAVFKQLELLDLPF